MWRSFNAFALTIGAVFFQGNTAQGNGGAIDSNAQSVGAVGSLKVSGLDPVLSPIVFLGNNAVTGSGGAINTADNTVLSNDIFGPVPAGNIALANTAALAGGAVNATGGTNGSATLNVSSCYFASNEVTGATGTGGAISTSAITDVETSTFSRNDNFIDNDNLTGSIDGGAIAYVIRNLQDPATPYNSSLTLNQDSFDNNQSAGRGGAVWTDVGVNSGMVTVLVTNSTFNNNTASVSGGGVCFDHVTSGTGTVTNTLTNDTFFQNLADFGGGIALVDLTNNGTGKNTAVLTSLTVNQNDASTAGGGLYVANGANGAVSMDNNIFDGNTVSAPGYNGPLDVTLLVGLAMNDIGYNLVGTSDTMFTVKNSDILNNNPVLANALCGRLESWWNFCTQVCGVAFCRKIHSLAPRIAMQESLQPAQEEEAQKLAQTFAQATYDDVLRMARILVASDPAHLFGDTEFTVRDILHASPPKPTTVPGAKKNGYQGSSVTCPHCDYAAAYHDEPPHAGQPVRTPPLPARLLLLPTLRQRPLSLRRASRHYDHRLTPAAQQLTTLAGGVGPSFEKGSRSPQGDGWRASVGIHRRTHHRGRGPAHRCLAESRRHLRPSMCSGSGIGTSKDARSPTSRWMPPARGSRVRAAATPKAAWPMSAAFSTRRRPVAASQPYPIPSGSPCKHVTSRGCMLWRRWDRCCAGRRPGGHGAGRGLGGLDRRRQRFGTVHAEHFNRADLVVILDFYHAASYVEKLAKALHPQTRRRRVARRSSGVVCSKPKGVRVLVVLREWDWPVRKSSAWRERCRRC